MLQISCLVCRISSLNATLRDPRLCRDWAQDLWSTRCFLAAQNSLSSLAVMNFPPSTMEVQTQAKNGQGTTTVCLKYKCFPPLTRNGRPRHKQCLRHCP